MASLVQRTGNLQKTAELIKKALQIMPESVEAKQAQTCCGRDNCSRNRCVPKAGQVRLRWHRSSNWTNPRRKPIPGLDPIAEARQKALTRLAEILFEYSTDDGAGCPGARGLQA